MFLDAEEKRRLLAAEEEKKQMEADRQHAIDCEDDDRYYRICLFKLLHSPLFISSFLPSFPCPSPQSATCPGQSYELHTQNISFSTMEPPWNPIAIWTDNPESTQQKRLLYIKPHTYTHTNDCNVFVQLDEKSLIAFWISMAMYSCCDLAVLCCLLKNECSVL